MSTTADAKPGNATTATRIRATRPTVTKRRWRQAATPAGTRLTSTTMTPTMATTRTADPSGASSSSGTCAAIARGPAPSSGTARLTRPANAATSTPWNTTSVAKAPPTPTRDPPGRSRVGWAQGVKARAGDEQQRSVGQATGPAGRQPAAQQQVQGSGRQPEEQAGEDDEPKRAVDADAAHDLVGLGDPTLSLGPGRHRQ